jgi:predicted dithiol-disulfide oxidoreductase (DUF899 family)
MQADVKEDSMESHRMVSHDEWIAARQKLLADEKELTRLRDKLSQQRRDLPWERVDKAYVFDGSGGRETLAQLFAGRSQLIVYHFMFDTGWDAGCKSCSFWADNFDRIIVHLNHRDVTMVAVSRAPFAKLEAYRRRMGWSFKWVSSEGNEFNRDYYVSHTPDELAKGQGYYNYTQQKPYASEAPGISVFCKDASGAVFHTYSAYARGLDMLNGAYHLLDLVPKGRDEANLPHHSNWLRRHDEYAD